MRLLLPAVLLALSGCAAGGPGAAGLDGSGAGSGSTGSGAAPPGVPVPAGAQEATVVRLVDGDTVLLRGRGVGPLPASPTRVRVLLVDTPEVHGEQECFGPEASSRAGQLLPEGSTVRVEADRDPRDRFDRALLHVWTAQGVNVGEALVREGFAEVLVVQPNERHLAAFEAAERSAREAARGLWAACR